MHDDRGGCSIPIVGEPMQLPPGPSRVVGDLPNQSPTLVRCLLQERVEWLPSGRRKKEGELVINGEMVPFEVAKVV